MSVIPPNYATAVIREGDSATYYPDIFLRRTPDVEVITLHHPRGATLTEICETEDAALRHALTSKPTTNKRYSSQQRTIYRRHYRQSPRRRF